MRSRRAFLREGTLILAGPAVAGPLLAAGHGQEPPGRPARPALRIGLLTDVHHADKAAAGTRHYRDSRAKMAIAVAKLNEIGVDFTVELGDFIDSAGGDVGAELAHLEAIEAEYAKLKSPRHYVLGNHCVHVLRKEEFVEHTDMRSPHGSFDHGGVHVVRLDACFRDDGEPYGRSNFHWQDTAIPPAQIEWLDADLEKASRPAIVFVHQRLDDTEHHSVRNAAAVRAVLERHRVLAVLQGHSHENAHVTVNGVHYCVIRAMVEGAGLDNNGYAVLDVYGDGSMAVQGFVRQRGYQSWPVAHGSP